MWRYPILSAYSTAFWVIGPGRDWYTPRPRRGIMTPLLSLAAGSIVVCMWAVEYSRTTSTLIPKNYFERRVSESTLASRGALCKTPPPPGMIFCRAGFFGRDGRFRPQSRVGWLGDSRF